jgi:hypothetical protein
VPDKSTKSGTDLLKRQPMRYITRTMIGNERAHDQHYPLDTQNPSSYTPITKKQYLAKISIFRVPLNYLK